MLVNTRRNSEVGRAHPTLIIASNAAYSSRSSAVAASLRTRVAAVQDETSQPLRVPRGVLDGDRPALRHRQQREMLQAGVVGYRLEVGDPRIKTVVGHASIRQPVSTLVVPDHRGDPAELN